MCHLQEVYTKYKDKGLVVLGFDCADDKKIAMDLLRENDVTFPNIIDSSPAARKVGDDDYQNAACPTNYIIDRDGNIVGAWCGYEEGHPQAIAAIQKAGGELAEDIHREVNAKVEKSSGEVTTAATRLFEAIRSADYDHDWLGTVDWKYFPKKGADYNVKYNPSGWVRWVCRKFKADPIMEVKLGKVFANTSGLPTIHYELHLKDGAILQDDLPFKWDSESKQWVGSEGLDWHLRDRP
jgi:hypothetical protein